MHETGTNQIPNDQFIYHTLNMKHKLRRSINLNLFRLFITAALMSGGIHAFAQAPAKAAVSERNVRAEMNFLAGNAMQGRGSGTQFERIAAEYVGSQFMQFGLDPAGEIGYDGKPTYVQTVQAPVRETLTGLAIDGTSIKLGDGLIAFSIAGKEITGPVQHAKPGDAAKKGAVVILSLPADTKFEAIQGAVRQMSRDGAAAVIMLETNEIRANWAEVAGRKATLGRFGTLLAASTQAGEELSKIAEGANITLKGTFAAAPPTYTWNAIGKIAGTDPTLSSQVILISSHLDHLGVRPTASGDDKIFNGADDDASGTVAVLELARALASGAAPKRTVYFVCFGSEEAGGFGANYFVNNLPFPKDKLVANLEFEMIGRPDAKVKPEELWLTGYERSNLGPELAKRGAKLVQDPHPDQNFFQRSDNYTLARQGIIAHTVSSFGLHTDYHKASDEPSTIDFAHMTRSINAMVEPIKWLVNSDFVPTWNEGKKP